ncbi:hypothetical protein SMA75_20350 [Escherichia coli]|uniref:hypothetical protein n=1 Tax=Escherichia coli TaxID=562 RepID=UPI0030795FCD
MPSHRDHEWENHEVFLNLSNDETLCNLCVRAIRFSVSLDKAAAYVLDQLHSLGQFKTPYSNVTYTRENVRAALADME